MSDAPQIRDAEGFPLSDLRFTNVLVKNLIESATVEIYVIHEHTLNFLYANSVASRNTGYSEQELLSMRPQDLVPPERRHLLEERIQRLKSESEMISAETIHLRKDGTPYPVDLRIFRATRGSTPVIIGLATDTSERARAQQALELWRNRLELALAAADIAVWEEDRTSMTTTVTAGLSQVDVPADVPIPNMDWVDSVHPDDTNEMWQDWTDLTSRDGDGSYETTFRLPAKDGDWRWVRSRAKVTERDGSGNVLKVTGSYIDITDIHTKELALRESEERLDLAIRGGELAVWDTDCLAGETVQDERFAEITKRPLAGRIPDTEWFQYVHPDDQDALSASARAHIKGETPNYGVEFRILDADGKWRWLRSRGRVVQRAEDGTAIRAVGTYLDVTEQRRAQEALAASEADLDAMFESADVVVILLSPELDLLRSNKLAREYFEMLFSRPLTNLNSIADQLRPGDVEFLVGAVRRVTESGQSVNVEASITGPQGEVPFEFDFTPIYLPDGSLRGVGLFARDITRRKAEEAQVRQAQKLDSLGRMAAGIAHDFNNLVSVILGYGELATMALPPESAAREDLDEAMKAARSAAELTGQLLTFSKHRTTRPQDADVNELLEHAKPLVQRLLGTQVELTYTLSGSPLHAYLDPGQFEQVLMNLAANARDAIDGPGQVTVETSTVERTGIDALGMDMPVTLVVITFRDSGMGMDEHTMANLFEPFFTTKDEGKGTGLGLATVHGIITQSGGQIAVDSEPDVGTTFTISLPLTSMDDGDGTTPDS